MKCRRPSGRGVRRRSRRDLLAAAALLLLMTGLVAPLTAKDKQASPYALIFGTVWAPDDRPMPGVKVKIRRADAGKARWELMSDNRGEFAQRVPAGEADYVVWAEPKGHKGPAAETKVHITYDERQDIGLHLTK